MTTACCTSTRRSRCGTLTIGPSMHHPTQRTLYWRHQNLRRLRESWSEPGTTAVLEHGANPGLISHFTKQALLDIGERLLADKMVTGQDAEEIVPVDGRPDVQPFGDEAGREGDSLFGARHADLQSAQGS